MFAYSNVADGTAQNVTRTLNSTYAPDGTLTANTVTVTTASNPGIFSGTGSVTVGQIYCYSLWVKANTSNNFILEQYQKCVVENQYCFALSILTIAHVD